MKMRSNKFIYILFTVILTVTIIPLEAQVKVTDGADLTLDANSLLELESTNKGLLIPRLAINNLNLPAPLTAPVPAGMMVYSTGGTVANGFYHWTGTAWVPFATGVGSQWTTNGTNIYYNTGNVGIGASVPAEPLEVNGNIKIGSATTGTIRATNELVLRQDGDVYGPSILRLRNRNTENGAIFETTDGSITLVDFIFKNAANQRNIRFESRATMARTGAPSFHIGGASPDNPTLSLGDNYAAFNTNVRIGDYTTPLTALDVNGQITLRTGASIGAILVSDANGTGTWTTTLSVANAVVSANQTRTLNTAGNVTDMSFNIGASETWSFEFNLQNGCSGGGGNRWAITFPGGGTMRSVAIGNAGNTTSIASSIITASGGLTSSFCTFNSTAGWTRITGVVVNGGTAGTVQLQFASGTNGQTTTIYANSYLTARRVN